MRLDRANPQPFYHYINNTWTPIWTSPNPTRQDNPPTSLRLTTWNIDFQAPYARPRMAAALTYLSELHQSQDPPAVIFLQEMVDSDLEQIRDADWIRERFFVTDLSRERWRESHGYGTTTLVDKRLVVQRVFRVPYLSSRMGRDVLCVDVEMGGESGISILRLCNTHLESLVSIPPRRPEQLKLASSFMHGSGPPGDKQTDGNGAGNEPYNPPPVPQAAILAGDLNAFAPEDLTAPTECNLQDAFLVLGGQDGTEESFTWGQQVSEYHKKTFGCSRMDKVLFCGAVEVKGLKRIGAGVVARVAPSPRYYSEDEEEEEEGEDDDDEEEVWATDHLGLQAEFEVIAVPLRSACI